MQQRVEPYYTLIDDESQFRVICTSQDQSNKTLREDLIVIEKKGCVIYSTSKYNNLFSF